jgi:hypothetical protein
VRPVLTAQREASLFVDSLLPGERLEAVFWCAHRYPLAFEMVVVLFDVWTLLLFWHFRRYEFCAITDRRVLFMKSNGLFQPYRDQIEQLPREAVRCTWYVEWIGTWVDLKVAGESGVRRLYVGRPDRQAARVCLSLR